MDTAQAKIARYEAALRWYADPERWIADGAIQTPRMEPLLESPAAADLGHRARLALSGDSRIL